MLAGRARLGRLGGLAEEEFNGGAADLDRRLPHRADRHDGRAREIDVVVPDQGDVFGDADRSHHHERLQHAHGEQVVRGEHRVGAAGGRKRGDQLTDPAPFEHTERARLEHLEARSRVRGDHGAGPVQTLRHLGDADRPTDERDAAPPAVEQVPGCDPAALDVVDGDGGEGSVARAAVDENDRGACLAQPPQRGEVSVDGGDEDARNAVLLEHFEQAAFALAGVVASAEEHGVAVVERAGLRPVGDIHEERVAGVEHNEAEAAAVACAELPRGVVAHESEFVDRVEHP